MLNTDGTFELIPNTKFDFDLDYVCRSETLDAGNGYVGIMASEDSDYINKSYTMFLEGWLYYIGNNRKRQYLDIYSSETEEEIISKIKDFYKKKE